MVVLSCDHAGLRPVFQRFEDEMRRRLDRIDDPREMLRYINVIRAASQRWMSDYERELLNK